VQLYEAAAYLIFAWLSARAARPAPPLHASAPPHLRSFLVGLLGYGLTRWLFEPFHAQSATMAGGLLTAQVVGLGLALGALWLLGGMTPFGIRRSGESAPDGGLR
jgi:prolipoprotein diacylglyceryltransferase